MEYLNEAHRLGLQFYNFFSFLRIPPFSWEIYISDLIGLSLSESRLFLNFFFMVALAIPV